MAHTRLISELPHQDTFQTVRENIYGDPGAEDECLRRLAAAVVLSAIRAAAGESETSSKRIREAKAWLLDEENESPWFELAGIRRERILAWVGAGCKITRFKGLTQLGSIKQPSRKQDYRKYELKTESPEEKGPNDPDLGPEY